MKKTVFMIMGLTLLSTPGQAAELDKVNVAKDSKFVMHLDFLIL